jgi:hypothetical protein
MTLCVFGLAVVRIEFARIEFRRIDFDKSELNVNLFLFGCINTKVIFINSCCLDI